MEQKTIVYYIDGQKIGTVTNYPFDTFNWLKFSDSSIEDGTLWLDNIEVRQMNTAPFEIKANNGVLEITANEKSTSFLGDKISAALLYAMYDNNGRLLKADISSLTKNELQNDFGSFKISAYIPDGAKTAKVFLFEDASDLKPLFRVMKKKITAYR